MRDQPELDRAVEAALEAKDPFESLREAVVEFKNEGVSKETAYSTLDAFRVRHEDDLDQAKHDSVLEVMLTITGWCAPLARIYPPSP